MPDPNNHYKRSLDQVLPTLPPMVQSSILLSIERSRQYRAIRMPLVERLRIERKMSVTQIHNEMKRMVDTREKGWEACINHRGEIWSLGTLAKDIKVQNRVWENAVNADVIRHRALLIAEMEQVKKRAWEKDDMKGVVSGADRQIEILGLKQPERVEIKHGVMDEWARTLEQAKREIADRDKNKVVDTTVVEQLPKPE